MSQPLESKMPLHSHVTIHKDDLKDLKIGEQGSALIKGVVRSIATHPEHDHLRNVEFEHQVDHQGQPKEDGPEDLATMRKKMVEKHGEAEYK